MKIQELVNLVVSEFESIDKDIKSLQDKEIEIQETINESGNGYLLADIEKTAKLRSKLLLITESLTKAKQARETMSKGLSNDIRNTVIQLQEEHKKEFKAEHEELKTKILDTAKELRHLLKTSKDISNKSLIEFKSESRKLLNYLDDQSQKDFNTIGIGFNLVPDFKGDRADLNIIDYVNKQSQKDRTFLEVVS